MPVTDALSLLSFQTEDVWKLKSKRARLIGNDPGTGKTYEGIALDQLNRSGDGHKDCTPEKLAEWFPNRKLKTLIVAPKSVLGVWDYHCMELTDEDVYVYDYSKRAEFFRAATDKRRSGYFIINYESLRIKDAAVLAQVAWFHIIADECHRVKNRKSQQTQAFWKIKALYKTAMSGTPADNKPQDLWAILHWLWPNFYTSYWKFVNAYIRVTEEKNQDGDGYRKLHEPINMPHLHAQMAPWFVRRRKEDVLTDLPPKYYSKIWVDLTPKQRTAYDQMRKTMAAWVEAHEAAGDLETPVIANAAIAQLVRLQQFADAYVVPRLDEDGEQVYRTVRKKLKDGTVELREVPVYDVEEPAAKIDALMDILEDRGDEQVIIWSRFKSVVDLITARLDKKGISYGLLTGDVSQADRDRHVEDFQQGRTRCFVGTIAAGGVGITLTAASTVVFVDRWWSPSINVQAEDRAHRIGQTEAVEVIDLMAKNTVDLGQHQQLELKAKWLRMLLGDEVSPGAMVGDLDLSAVIEEDEGGE